MHDTDPVQEYLDLFTKKKLLFSEKLVVFLRHDKK